MGAELVQERKQDEDLPDDCEHPRSYHLFFICPDGESSTYDISIEPDGPSEDGSTVAVNGSGRTGWSVSVSLLAPFAVITLSERETFEDGSTIDPTIETLLLDEKGERIEPEVHLREVRGDGAFQRFLMLREQVIGALSKSGIAVLPEAEWRRLVPWVRAEGKAVLGILGDQDRVLDALFIEAF